MEQTRNFAKPLEPCSEHVTASLRHVWPRHCHRNRLVHSRIKVITPNVIPRTFTNTYRQQIGIQRHVQQTDGIDRIEQASNTFTTNTYCNISEYQDPSSCAVPLHKCILGRNTRPACRPLRRTVAVVQNINVHQCVVKLKRRRVESKKKKRERERELIM